MNVVQNQRIETRRAVLRRGVLGVAGLGVVGLSTACGGGAGESGGGSGAGGNSPVRGATEVAVRDNVFEPAAIEVPAGATVTWRWEGRHPHNVVSDGFESEVQTDGAFTHTFAEPGRYAYRCTLHGGMDGEVVVATPDGS